MIDGRPTVDCPECGHANPDGSTHCRSCGLIFPTAPPTDTPPPLPERRQRRRWDPEAREAERLQRYVVAVRVIYGVLAGVAVASLLRSHGLWRDVGAEPLWRFAYPCGAAALIAAILFGHLRPALWAVGMASLWSLVALFAVALGGTPVLELVMAVTLWTTATILANPRGHRRPARTRSWRERCRDENVRLAVFAATGNAWLLEDRDESASTSPRTLVLLGATAAAFLLAFAVVIQRPQPGRNVDANRPQAVALDSPEAERRLQLLDSRLREFEHVWERSDLDAYAAMFTPEQRKSFWPKMERKLEALGWSHDLPPFVATDPRGGSPARQVIDFEMQRGRLRTRWVFEHDTWWLYATTLSGIR